MRLTPSERRARREARDTARASGRRLDLEIARLLREAGWRGVSEFARAVMQSEQRTEVA